MKPIVFFDSTLRDGAQAEGISFSVQDKLNIVRALDDFGVQYIEAGNPGSNPKELQFFEAVRSLPLRQARLCAFGSTARKGVEPAQDANVQSLLHAGTPVVAIFGKAWDLHVTEILKITREENLRLVTETLRCLRDAGKEIVFDAEHFFDGYKADPDYALAVLRAACDGGAGTLCLCDTNGGCLPHEIGQITAKVCAAFPDRDVAIHCHDDSGCAVANSIAAVLAGAVQVQGTLIGFGERCGNADLATIIADLALKCGYDCPVRLESLKQTAREIAEIANVRIRHNHPYIGKSAFAHKAGMHIDGVQKLSASFEHVDPAAVGNERKFLISEVAGRGTVLPRIRRIAPHLTKQSPETARITERLKERECDGYQYEGAEASFELFIKKQLGLWQPHFHVILYKTNDDFPAPDGEQQSTALIKIEVDGKTLLTCDEGNGPVNALDRALRKALCAFYPELNALHLTDFKVRVIESSGTDAKIRVLIESADRGQTFTTIGVSNDVIEASLTALVDSFEYILSKKENAAWQ